VGRGGRKKEKSIHLTANNLNRGRGGRVEIPQQQGRCVFQTECHERVIMPGRNFLKKVGGQGGVERGGRLDQIAHQGDTRRRFRKPDSKLGQGINGQTSSTETRGAFGGKSSEQGCKIKPSNKDRQGVLQPSTSDEEKATGGSEVWSWFDLPRKTWQ